MFFDNLNFYSCSKTMAQENNKENSSPLGMHVKPVRLI